jgi:O-antigen/teichoic acid export membrane protein
MISSLTRTVGPVFVALGRPDLLFRVGLFAGVVVFCGSVVGVHFGVSGVALAFGITTALTAIPTIFLASSQISASPRLFASELEPVVSATGFALLVMVALRSALGMAANPSWATLVSVGIAGAVSYWGMIALRHPPALDDLLKVLGLRESARSGPSAN